MGSVIGVEVVREFLQRYGRAVAAGETDAIVACWDVPALVLSDERAHALGDAMAVERFVRGLAGSHGGRGDATAEPCWIETEPLGRRVVSADVTWAVLDGDGTLTTAERSRYLLRLDDSGALRIRVAVTTGRAEDGRA